jgi:diguanylate cyclase (GGDEF)-like protein/PAS domain S-box-containing protein
MLAGEIETYQMEKRYFHKDGHVVWVLLSVSLVHDEGGEPLYFISQIQDVTERKRAEERLRQAEARYRTLVERMPAVTYVQEIGGPESAMYMSPQIEALTGYLPEECKDPDLRWRMVHPDDREWMQSEDERAVEPGEVVTTEYRVVHRDGRTVWVRNESVVVEEEKSGSRYWQGFMLDITERKRAEERLHHQAHHDQLTDLPNRQLFLERLGQALKRTKRRKERAGGKVAVLFVDLDNFKIVNDSLGHEAGDLLLARIGERLQRCLRPEDTLSRFGGDEFVMLLEDVPSPRDAVRVAERIRQELRNPFVLEGRELVLRASVGIALGNGRTKSPGELLKDADTAMYRAKEEVSGYRIFEPKMYEQALRRLKLENDMRRALEAQEFVVHYQPIVDLRTGGVWGSEALVRWEHPERGLLEPSEFVAVAEETGLIVPLGERVLEEACRQAAQWQRQRPEADPLVVCVNLSARQLRHPDLARTVKGVLQSSGLEGRRLCLDITETLYITVLEGNTTALDDLKRMGVRLSIDDFGMGYSSLSYLKRLPADTLKIDRSFVAGLGEDVEDTAIVQMTISLAHTLGMRIVAEGVQCEEQAEQLKEMGCDLGQGFYFARPLSSEAMPELLSV